MGAVVDRLVGTWLLEPGEGDSGHDQGVLLLTPDGWCSMQIDGTIAWAGRFGIDADRFLVDIVVSTAGDADGGPDEWRWYFNGDLLVLDDLAGCQHHWHRSGTDVVASLGPE